MKKSIGILIMIMSTGLMGLSAQDKAKTEFAQEFIKAWKRHKVYTLRLAEAMPEAHFGYKLDTATRSFGEIVMHISGANYMFSSIASQEESPRPRTDFNAEGLSKTKLIKTLTESFDYALERLMKVSSEALAKTAPWGNPIETSTTRSGIEIFHVMREHAAHHRGQMGAYLRLKGITPPAFID